MPVTHQLGYCDRQMKPPCPNSPNTQPCSEASEPKRKRLPAGKTDNSEGVQKRGNGKIVSLANYQRRFWANVNMNGPIINDGLGRCWMWIGKTKSGPRGKFYYRGSNRFAHRVSLMLSGVHLPDGLQVCHRCDNPPCVRPSHLFAGTQSDNMLDCSSKGRLKNQNMDKHVCKHGHPFSGDNLKTYIRDGKQRRRCVTCQRSAEERSNAKRRNR